MVYGEPICFASRVLLNGSQRFFNEEAVRPTATLRKIEPFKPISPACSDPIALIDRSRTALDHLCRGHKK
jgi:hypothetical protein